MVTKANREAYGWVERLCGDGADANCFAVLHNYFVDFSIALEMQVFVNGTRGVNIGVRGVASSTSLETVSLWSPSRGRKLYLHHG
jgi:hypothetical protein